jgi:enoyl-CoA hydratase/carnithine racemase
MALTPSAALDLLRSPFALEDLGGGPPLVVDVVDMGDTVDQGDVAETLRTVACVTVAVVTDPADPPACTRRFDVVVSKDRVEALEAAVRTNPIASVALVQLLRAGEALDVWGALFAESSTYSMLQAGPEYRAWLASRHPRKTTFDVEPAVIAVRDGAQMSLTLNRPAVHNAFNAAMRDALVAHLRTVAADVSIDRLLIDGAGSSFCSGGDLDEFGTTPDPATAHVVRTTRSPAWWMAQCAARTSVALHGACIGAGIELAAFAGQVTAAEGAFFQLPEVGLGLVPGAGGTVSLPRRIGRQRTAWLALSGERLDTATALTWGLVDRVSGTPRPR